MSRKRASGPVRARVLARLLVLLDERGPDLYPSLRAAGRSLAADLDISLSTALRALRDPQNAALHAQERVLAALVGSRSPAQVIVGFAAETAADPDELLELGRAKLARKGCDLLVLNDVSGGAVFGAADNTVSILGAAGVLDRASGDKNVVAHRILDAIVHVKGTPR